MKMVSSIVLPSLSPSLTGADTVGLFLFDTKVSVKWQ